MKDHHENRERFHPSGELMEQQSNDLEPKARRGVKEEGILEEFLAEYGTEVLNMIYTQFNLEDALEVRGEEKFMEGEAIGEVKGKAEGKAEGKTLELISLIRKKQQRGLTVEAIAEILEKDVKSINPIFKTIKDNPIQTDDMVLQLIEEQAHSIPTPTH